MAKKNFRGVLFGEDSPAYDEIDNTDDISVEPHQIKILPELEHLIPPLSEEEERNLENSLTEEGCREPLVLWKNEEDFILVDGHNRFRLCTKNNIPFKTVSKNFSDILSAKNWMLANQMSRRNLSPFQMSYLRGLRYETEKLSVGRQKSGQNDQINSLTSEKLAEEFSVGEKTIRRDARFTQGLNRLAGDNQRLRWAILNGQIQAKKSTVAELNDYEDKFLRNLQTKLEEISNLEQAIKMLNALGENPAKNQQHVEEYQAIYKHLTSLLRKIQKKDKQDPNRTKMIKEAKSLFNEYLKQLS